jgi:hypothetical protein
VKISLISQPVLSNIRAITLFRLAAVAGTLRAEQLRMNDEMHQDAYPSAILMASID